MRTRAGRSRALAAALALASCPSSARADPAQPSAPAPASDPIAAARAAMEDLRYDDALKLVEPLLAAPERARRVEALQITALAHLILGDQEAGKRAVAELYALAPGFSLSDPSLPARATSVFADEAARPHARSVIPILRPSDKDVLEYELAASAPATRVELACRAGASGPFLPVATNRSGTVHRFRLPSAKAYRCYAVALDPDGLPLGRLGTPAHPFDVRPRALPKDPPVTSRWWFWAGLGTVAAAAATAVVVVATRPSEPTPPAADITATAKAWAW